MYVPYGAIKETKKALEKKKLGKPSQMTYETDVCQR